ncbi:MAG: protein kinase domain-containing protein [Planctomycetota bacterium]
MTPPGENPREAAALPRESGGFLLLRVLGRGGMGVVYEAEELVSGRRVALKVLMQELSLSGEAFERFRREARIAASLSDSSCVFVFGAHVIDGAPAIAMELCPGETLEHRIATGVPIPIEDAVRWTIEILDGLEAAHRAGVVHRDVKPSNCFTTAQGRVKVGDFGLSRSLEQDVQLTRSGVFLGSPLYASPEQVRGRAVDLRSDIYSTGATLYALLTGRSPYQGENLGEVLARILSESPPPPSELRKEIPRGLDRVVLRAMSRDPAQRYPTHADMREALRGFLGKTSTAAGPLRRFMAFLADTWVLNLVNIPLMGLWAKFDPATVERVTSQAWSARSEWLVVAMTMIGLLYFGLAEGLFHRTIGKWITGQRVVAADTSRGLQRRMSRALLWFAPSLLATIAGFWLGEAPPWVALGVGSGVPLAGSLVMLSTMRRRNGWRGLHELLTGTRVVAEPFPFARFVRQKAPPPSRLEAPEGLPERIGVYATVGRVGRTASGEIVEASDTHLERRVWIHVRDPAAAPIAPQRRSFERPSHLRWLDGFEEHGRRHEVFEAPGGALLQDCCAYGERMPWQVAHGVLSALAEEVDREPAPRISLEQVWIDRSWSLRILDEPLGEAVTREPLELLALAANTSLREAGAREVRLPPDLPLHAEPAARRLLGLDAPFDSVADARHALAQSANRPQGLSWKIRGIQMLLGSGIWIVFCCISIFSTRLLVIPQARAVMESQVLLIELGSGRRMVGEDFEREPLTPTGPELDEKGLEARSILVAQILEKQQPFGQGVSLKLSPKEQELVAQNREEHAGATQAQIAAARAQVASERSAEDDLGKFKQLRILRGAHFVIPFVFASAWSIGSVLAAFLLRGGLSLLVVSLALRDAAGRRAGRLRCAWRAILTALPLLGVYFIPFPLAMNQHPGAAAIALGVAAVVHLALIAVSLRTPARGWQDRLAGTRLVPR